MKVNIAILTVTDTRTFENDKSGAILVKKIEEASHNLVDRKICKDEKEDIKEILKAWINQKEIDVWGDGEQTRSFMYIDDCLEGTKKIFNSELTDVYNLGSDEQVSINQMIDMIEQIADYKVNRKYLLDKPKGVRGRSSDNSKIKLDLDWAPSISLMDGLTKTYKWIDNELKSGENTLKFKKS